MCDDSMMVSEQGSYEFSSRVVKGSIMGFYVRGSQQ